MPGIRGGRGLHLAAIAFRERGRRIWNGPFLLVLLELGLQQIGPHRGTDLDRIGAGQIGYADHRSLERTVRVDAHRQSQPQPPDGVFTMKHTSHTP